MDFLTWEWWLARSIEDMRNIGMIFFGMVAVFIGMPLAIWRTITASEQARTANRNADLTEKGQDIDRVHEAIKLLESNHIASRITGVAVLAEL